MATWTPMLGASPEQKVFITDGLLQGGFFFRLISGQVSFDSGPFLDLHFLALTFALIGGLTILLLPKMRNATIIGSWLFILFLTVIGPHNTAASHVFFYPLGEGNPVQTYTKTNTVDADPAATATGRETNVFTAQLVAIDFVNRIHRALYSGLFETEDGGVPRLRNRRDEAYKGLLFSTMPRVNFNRRPDLQQEIRAYQKLCQSSMDDLFQAPHAPTIYPQLTSAGKPLMLSAEKSDSLDNKTFTVQQVMDLVQSNRASYQNQIFEVYPPFAVTFEEPVDQINAYYATADALSSADPSDETQAKTALYRDKQETMLKMANKYPSFFALTEQLQYPTNGDRGRPLVGTFGALTGIDGELFEDDPGSLLYKDDGMLDDELVNTIQYDISSKGEGIENLPVGIGFIRVPIETTKEALEADFSSGMTSLSDAVGTGSLWGAISASGIAAVLTTAALGFAAVSNPIGWIALGTAVLAGGLIGGTAGAGLGAVYAGGTSVLSNAAQAMSEPQQSVVYNCRQLHRKLYDDGLSHLITITGVPAQFFSESNNFTVDEDSFLDGQNPDDDRLEQGVFRDFYGTWIAEARQKRRQGRLTPDTSEAQANFIRFQMMSNLAQAGVARTDFIVEQPTGDTKLMKGLAAQASPDIAQKNISSSWLGNLLGSLGNKAAEAGSYVGALFAGMDAVAYINFLSKILGVIMVLILSITPLLFLMGLMVPSYAPGMLILSIGSVIILAVVPITFSIMDAVFTVLRGIVENNKAAYGSIDEALITFVAAGAYTSITAITMFILFKSGDPSSLQQIGQADQFANKFGQIGENIAKTVGIAAASIGTASAAGGIGALRKGEGLKGAVLAAKKQGTEVFASTSTNVPVIGQIMKEASPKTAHDEGAAYAKTVRNEAERTGESVFDAAKRMERNVETSKAEDRYEQNLATPSREFEMGKDSHYNRIKGREKGYRLAKAKDNSQGESFIPFQFNTTQGKKEADSALDDFESTAFKIITENPKNEGISRESAQKMVTDQYNKIVEQSVANNNPAFAKATRFDVPVTDFKGNKNQNGRQFGYTVDTNNNAEAGNYVQDYISRQRTKLENKYKDKDGNLSNDAKTQIKKDLEQQIRMEEDGKYFISTGDYADHDLIEMTTAKSPTTEQPKPPAKRERMFPSRLPKNKRDA